jgi:hypothetical protein
MLCKDLQTDAENYGTCGHVCPSEYCVAGECCPVGAIGCGDTCIADPSTDMNNCGSCGNVCMAPNNYCSFSQCQYCDFDAGYGLCPYGSFPTLPFCGSAFAVF